MKKELKLPKFNNEDAEREFWAKIDLTDYYEPEDFVSARCLSVCLNICWFG